MIKKERIHAWHNGLVRVIKFRILHANDSPHRIALGVGLGLFLACMPIFGLHILIALGLCILFRANKLAALLCVWVSNPFTLVPIYYSDYYIGTVVLNWFSAGGGPAADRQVKEMISQFDATGFFHLGFWKDLMNWIGQVGPELWLGAFIMGFLVSAVAYFATYKLIVQHRKKSRRRRFRQYQ